ncbi:malectin domain-containing carbohydrate-binding protein, partial [Flavobacterium sp. ASW18X]|uniref:malectin domain-containing carbohydrate-binding protein n=1 Tax=Flavobacterium sp. ASW18X TaxID=2572595 RepID=UPI0010ADF5AF
FDTSTPSTDSTMENPTFIYTTAGTYNVQLRVSDGNGGTGVANLTIHAGNNLASFTFTSPSDGGFMSWGDDISVALSVSDVEDGDTNGNPGTEGSGIACEAVVVTPSLGHLTHFHDTPSIDACPQDLTLGAEGHQTNGEADIFYVLNANYTDNGGLQSFGQIRIYPKVAEAEHYDDSSQGINIIQNTDDLGGAEDAIRADHNSYIVYQGRNLENITSLIYRLSSSVSGGSIELRLDSPTGTLLGTSAVPVTGSANDWANVELGIVDPGGKHDLYIVFKNASAGTGIVDLNYIEFVGAGVSVDKSAPVVEEVKSINTTQVRVFFNEKVTAATAEDLSNYMLDNGITINSAVLQEDGRTVLLTTTQLTPDVQYNLNISNIENTVGLTIQPDSYPFSIFTPIRINAGAGELTTSYGIFSADQYVTGGQTYTASSLAIANTSDDLLYQSERYGNMNYEIPIMISGKYDIRLHFAEIYIGVDGNTGTRIFNVSIEGEEVLSDFNILSETNSATALIKEYDDVLITDGLASIAF